MITLSSLLKIPEEINSFFTDMLTDMHNVIKDVHCGVYDTRVYAFCLTR